MSVHYLVRPRPCARCLTGSYLGGSCASCGHPQQGNPVPQDIRQSVARQNLRRRTRQPRLAVPAATLRERLDAVQARTAHLPLDEEIAGLLRRAR